LRSGGKLAIVNMQPTNLDRFASWKFDDLRLTFEELARLTSL